MKKAFLFNFLPSVKPKNEQSKPQMEAINNNIEQSMHELSDQSQSGIKLVQKFSEDDDKKIITLFDQFKCCHRVAKDFFPTRNSSEICLRYRKLAKYENQMSQLYQMMCQSLILQYRSRESLQTWDNINKFDLEERFDSEFLLEFYQKVWKHRIFKAEFNQQELSMLREYRDKNLVPPAKSQESEQRRLKRIGCSVSKVLDRMRQGVDVFEYLYWKNPQLDLESEKLLIKFMEGPRMLLNAKKKKQAEIRLKMSAKVWPLEYCRIKCGRWSLQEDSQLIQLARHIKYQRDMESWKQIEHKFPKQTYKSIFFRRMFLDKEWALRESCEISSLLIKHKLVKSIIPKIKPKHSPHSVYLHIHQIELLYRRSKHLSKIAKSLIERSGKACHGNPKQSHNSQSESDQQPKEEGSGDDSSSINQSIDFNEYISSYETYQQKKQRSG